MCLFCVEAAQLGTMRADHDATVTYEGDNNVLLQQATNWLLKGWNDAKQGGASVVLEASPLGSLHFLIDAEKTLQKQFSASSIADVLTLQCKFVEFICLCLLNLYQYDVTLTSY